MEDIAWLAQQTTQETVWSANWVSTLVSLGGTGLLLYLTVLTGRLRRRDEVKELLDEKDKQITRCETDMREWRAVAEKKNETLQVVSETNARLARTIDDMTDQAELSTKLLEAMARKA